MEIKNSREKSSDGSTELRVEELHRITVSKKVEKELVSIVEEVNENFEGGKVNKTQVANWIILRFKEKFGDAEIREIRAEHFDEISVLEAVLRRAKESGKVPSEIKELLQKQMGFDENFKKGSKNKLTKNVINVYNHTEE